MKTKLSLNFVNGVGAYFAKGKAEFDARLNYSVTRM